MYTNIICICLYIYRYTTYTKLIHVGLLDICTYPFEFVMAQISFRPLVVWEAILGSRLSVTPFFIKVDNGLDDKDKIPSRPSSFSPMASLFPRISSNQIFSCQECHDGGEAGAGKHLLDLLVMRGDLGVFIMASWWHRFFDFFFQMQTGGNPGNIQKNQ